MLDQLAAVGGRGDDRAWRVDSGTKTNESYFHATLYEPDNRCVDRLWADAIRPGSRSSQRHDRAKQRTHLKLHGTANIDRTSRNDRSMVIQHERPSHHLHGDWWKPVHNRRLGDHEPRVLHGEPDHAQRLCHSGEHQITRQAACPEPSMLRPASRMRPQPGARVHHRGQDQRSCCLLQETVSRPASRPLARGCRSRRASNPGNAEQPQQCDRRAATRTRCAQIRDRTVPE